MSPAKAKELRDAGIAKATANAGDFAGCKWGDLAFSFVSQFLSQRTRHGYFLAEDVRVFATEGGLPEPNSLRAWGGVMIRAAKAGMIERVGYALTKNPRAHHTPAAAWEVAI